MDEIYVLVLSNLNEDGTFSDFDVFGLYSTRELAEKAAKWLKREDGLYNGCREDLTYNGYTIDRRIIDYNLP